ncbi:hypothetical protein EVAR_61257_1 [Eumeta japonica]|uniref:Uncharacterized protein n=1 Tax=Eumeta variegata TaxID=151549 RepID=A0A4C1Z586_EUMVA|nr:hypothetical protein EVAR_61257_1 [Eumeta japonica]
MTSKGLEKSKQCRLHLNVVCRNIFNEHAAPLCVPKLPCLDVAVVRLIIMCLVPNSMFWNGNGMVTIRPHCDASAAGSSSKAGITSRVACALESSIRVS